MMADPASSLGTDYFSLDDLLTEEEREVRDRVRSFCDKEVVPVINDYWEREEFPFELLPKIAALNIAGTTIEGYGCPGMSPTAAGLISRELARGDGGLTTFFAVHSGVAMTSVATLGSEEQKERWLPPMARMEKIGAFGLTEPQHGSDAGLLETTARREGEEYVIDGEKRWIGNASFAEVTVVWAREEDDKLAAFLVEKGTPGFESTVLTGKVSQRTVLNTDVKLEGVRVPVENRLANSSGFGDAVRVLTPTRHNVAWEAVGHAAAAYEVALAYAKERVQFGKPIASFQLIQGKLARMLADITAMQTLCFRL
ncbi:MAG TPA: acyl-CoA dehydrogenase family protein, partial [Rubrobacteraceae bacterium]|nr:acyl-CoA dehydrogenase family protein [Rubrobacteraceae bacterium]